MHGMEQTAPLSSSRGRGRGRAPDPQRVAQTRDTILQSALTIFLERGFEGARMVDVAAHAGLAKGTLYLHFSDKEALFEFVLQRLISEPLAQMRLEIPPPGQSLRARLDRLFVPLLEDFEETGRASVLRLIIAEGARFPALAAIHQRLVIDPMMEAIDEALDSVPDNCRIQVLRRFPFIIGAPVIMATVWNELWSRGQKADTREVMSAFLDLVFGPI